jgi:hydroxymethylpyrimidine/phosphomethylpyrimidine kinase
MKGGHGTGRESIDILVTPKSSENFTAPRIATKNTHGTGCTLSSAITAELAKGHSLSDSIHAAKIYVTQALAASETLNIGKGSGPVHHFHRFWK